MCVCLTEYDEEKTMNAIREEGREEGIEKGRTGEIFDSVNAKDYSAERGAEKLGITMEEFQKQYDGWLENKDK